MNGVSNSALLCYRFRAAADDTGHKTGIERGASDKTNVLILNPCSLYMLAFMRGYKANGKALQEQRNAEQDVGEPRDVAVAAAEWRTALDAERGASVARHCAG